MSAEAIALLDVANEVGVETVSSKGVRHAVPIWVVVVDGAAYVASVNAAKGRWYRELTQRDGAIVVDGRRFPVHAVPVSEPELIRRVSEEYSRKYKRSRASLASMQRPEVLATTLRLDLLP